MWHILSKATGAGPAPLRLKLQCTWVCLSLSHPGQWELPRGSVLNRPTHCSDFQQVGVQEILVECMSVPGEVERRHGAQEVALE